MWDKHFFDVLGKKLGLKELSEWYRVGMGHFQEHKPLFAKKVCISSLTTALQSAYPTHEWILWKFDQVPQGFWDIHENQKSFIEWAGKQLQIQCLEDWYAISETKVRLLCLCSPLKKFRLFQLLSSIYQNHQWDVLNFLEIP